MAWSVGVDLVVFMLNFQKMSDPTKLFRQVESRYASQPWAVKAHVKGRLIVCPFEKMLPHIPAKGSFLDIGCGHGVFPHLVQITRPEMLICGQDASSKKISIAQQSAERVPRVKFSSENPWLLENKEWDCITIIDVLYLLSEADKTKLIVDAVRHLKKGGVILVKELDTSPFLKFAWSYFQEVAAVYLARITQGDGLHFEPVQALFQRIHRQGLDVRTIPLHDGYLYPHVLVAATKR